MKPSFRRAQFEALLGVIIAGGTPWFIWAYLRAYYPNLPPAEEMDSGLWSYLVPRVILFSFLIEFSFLMMALFMRKAQMIRMIATINVMYAMFVLYYLKEWW